MSYFELGAFQDMQLPVLRGCPLDRPTFLNISLPLALLHII